MLSRRATWVVLAVFAASAVPVIAARTFSEPSAQRPAMLHLLDRR